MNQTQRCLEFIFSAKNILRSGIYYVAGRSDKTKMEKRAFWTFLHFLNLYRKGPLKVAETNCLSKTCEICWIFYWGNGFQCFFSKYLKSENWIFPQNCLEMWNRLPMFCWDSLSQLIFCSWPLQNQKQTKSPNLRFFNVGFTRPLCYIIHFRANLVFCTDIHFPKNVYFKRVVWLWCIWATEKTCTYFSRGKTCFFVFWVSKR